MSGKWERRGKNVEWRRERRVETRQGANSTRECDRWQIETDRLTGPVLFLWKKLRGTTRKQSVLKISRRVLSFRLPNHGPAWLQETRNSRSLLSCVDNHGQSWTIVDNHPERTRDKIATNVECDLYTPNSSRWPWQCVCVLASYIFS